MTELFSYVKDFLAGKPMYSPLVKFLNFLLSASITSYVFVKLYHPYVLVDITDYKAIYDFFITGYFWLPLMIFVITHYSIKFSSSLMFSIVTERKSNKWIADVIGEKVSKKDIKSFFKVLNNNPLVPRRQRIDKSAFFKYYEHIKSSIPHDALQIAATAAKTKKDEISNNFNLAFKAIIAVTFYFFSIPHFGWVLYLLSIVVLLASLIFFFYAFLVLDVAPALIQKIDSVFKTVKSEFEEQNIEAIGRGRENFIVSPVIRPVSQEEYDLVKGLIAAKGAALGVHEKKNFVRTGLDISRYSMLILGDRQFCIVNTNIFDHLLESVITEAQGLFPENFGQRDAYKVLEALYNTRPVAMHDLLQYTELLNSEHFAWIMEIKNEMIAGDILRLELYRNIKVEKSAKNGETEFEGGVFHVFKHFSCNGVPLSTMPAKDNLVVPRDIYGMAVLGFFFRARKPTNKGKASVIPINDKYQLEFYFYHEENTDVYFINSIYKSGI